MRVCYKKSYYISYEGLIIYHTRVIQKIRRERCCPSQKVFWISKLTHGKIQNNILYQRVMFHFIWLSSLHYYTRIFYRNFLYIVVTPVRPSEEFLVTWTLSTSQAVANSYSRIWLVMSCRCAIRFKNFHFCIRGQSKVKTWRFGEVVVTGTMSTFHRIDKW